MKKKVNIKLKTKQFVIKKSPFTWFKLRFLRGKPFKKITQFFFFSFLIRNNFNNWKNLPNRKTPKSLPHPHSSISLVEPRIAGICESEFSEGWSMRSILNTDISIAENLAYCMKWITHSYSDMESGFGFAWKGSKIQVIKKDMLRILASRRVTAGTS